MKTTNKDRTILLKARQKQKETKEIIIKAFIFVSLILFICSFIMGGV